MIKIGDKVKSKNLEGPSQDEGSVVALFQPEYFVAKFCKQDPDETWSQNYPDWKQKPVVLAYFEKPQKSATLKEWIKAGSDEGFNLQECEQSYDANCPVTNQTAFPHDDDLEIIIGFQSEIIPNPIIDNDGKQ